jgi:hypothetical protein
MAPALQEWMDAIPYDGTADAAEDVAAELREQLRRAGVKFRRRWRPTSKPTGVLGNGSVRGDWW